MFKFLLNAHPEFFNSSCGVVNMHIACMAVALIGYHFPVSDVDLPLASLFG